MQCRTCQRDYPYSHEFFHRYTDRKGRKKLHTRCKVCAIKIAADWYLANKKRVSEWGRRYNIEHREARQRYQRKWVLKNPDYAKRRYARSGEKIRTTNKRWRNSHPEQVKDGIKRWQRANPEKVRQQRKRGFQARRARMVGAAGKLTSSDLRAIYATQSGRCFYCLTTLGNHYHVDHKVPLCRGGSNAPTNICCACASCNLTKGKMTEVEFRE